MIKLLALDFDGVLTDNKVYADAQGNEFVCCSKYDSEGINMLKRKNIDILVISSETNQCVTTRCKKLRIKVMQNINDKLDVLLKYMEDHNIKKEEVVFIGNDIQDLECLGHIDHSFLPADYPKTLFEGHPALIFRIQIVPHKGGEGAVRDVCEWILNFNRGDKFGTAGSL